MAKPVKLPKVNKGKGKGKALGKVRVPLCVVNASSAMTTNGGQVPSSSAMGDGYDLKLVPNPVSDRLRLHC